MSLIFAAYKTLDYEFMIEDFRKVVTIHDIFYSGGLFLSEDAFVEFDFLLWAFGEKMPTCGQDFHC